MQRLPFKFKRLDNEKKLGNNPTLEESLIWFEILKKYFYRKHISNEITLEPSNEKNCVESTDRYQHQSRTHVRHQHDREIKQSPQFYKICNYCRKNGHLLLRCFKSQTNRYRKTNLESRKQSKQQAPKSATPKMFKDFLKNNQDLSKNELPITTCLLINKNVEINPNLLIEKIVPEENPLHMAIMSVQIQTRGTLLKKRSPTPNRYHNKHYSRNTRNSSRSVTPHRKPSDS